MKKFFKTIGRDLRKQVQKAGVAAGKQSTTNLDVLGKGFKIGQADNKGPTSVVEAVKSRNVTLGDKYYVAPFKTNGFWVEDAHGTNVCEALNVKVAAALVKLLNESAK